MEWLTDIFNGNISAWHWAILGVLLLIMEIMGAAGFLIGTAIASFLMAVIIAVSPDTNWKWQLTIFAASSVIFSLIYMKRFSGFNEATDQPNLNNRAAQHIGKQAVLIEATANGMSRVQIGDTMWKVRSDQELDKGTAVTVTATDGMTLLVSAQQ